MTLILQIIAAILSIVGGIFIVYKNRVGYIIWILSNFIWLWLFGRTGLWISFAPFIFYQGMNVWGYIKWGKK